MRSRAAFGAAVGVAAVLALAGCGSGVSKPKNLALAVDRQSGLVGDPVQIKVTGAARGSTVTLTATAADHNGVAWTTTADFKADAHGGVDPATQAPLNGGYTGVDEMGLFWSMSPPPGSSAEFFVPPAGGFDTVLTATDQGTKTTLTVTRRFQQPGDTVQALTVAHDGFEGHLALPAGISGPRPAVILLGGSEGGESTYPSALLLAAKGYPALSVGYFNEPGTPPTLKDIPVEYFAKAATWLEQQPGVDKAHVLFFGASRGSEAALLTAQYFPDLVHGAFLVAPSAVAFGSLPDSEGEAWTLHGAQVLPKQSAIPVDKVSGPVLAFAGSDDQLWQSPFWAQEITGELDQAHNPYPHSVQIFQGAGHTVGSIPYLPMLTVYTEYGHLLELGGTRQANAAAQACTWKAMLDLLRSLSAGTG